MGEILNPINELNARIEELIKKNNELKTENLELRNCWNCSHWQWEMDGSHCRTDFEGYCINKDKWEKLKNGGNKNNK